MVNKNSSYLIQSNFGQKGNFEVVDNTREGLRHLFRDNDDPNLPWIRGPMIARGAFDPGPAPALIQSNFGQKGNFEVVVNINERLFHWSRNNDDPNLPWIGGYNFGPDPVGGNPALIQSNFGQKGNFEVVVNTRDGLQHWFRNNDDPNLQWHYGSTFEPDAVGQLALIQSNFGQKGNFEVVVNTRDGLRHWFRNNDDPNLPWIRGSTFRSGAYFQAPALIQSNFGQKGNFELILDGHHLFRDNDDPNLRWVGGGDFQGINGHKGAALIQSNFGTKGNFEAIVAVELPRGEDERYPVYALTHHFRDNDDPNLPWIRAPQLPT